MSCGPHAAAAIALVTVFLATSPTLSAQQAAPPADHSEHHPEDTTDIIAPPAGAGMTESMKMMASMKKSNATFDQLVAKMNAATGVAKTDVIAELLTALVSDRHSCEAMMAEKTKAK
jgi:hypothetical protein